MEYLAIFGTIAVGAVSLAMFVATVSDLRRTETRIRGACVLIGSIGAIVAFMFWRSPVPIGLQPVAAVVFVALTFGPVAIVFYALTLVTSGIAKVVARYRRRASVAV